MIGKWLGLIAVFLAFIGGIFVDTIGVWFLVGGVMIGLYAPYTGIMKSEG